MKYKVVVCDLDGTLLSSKHSLSEFVKSEIKRISKLGIKVILATGRHYIDVKSVAKELGLNTCIIASNGTRVYTGDGEILIMHNHKSGVVEKVFKYNLSKKVHLNIYQGKEWLVIEDNEELLSYHENSKFEYRKINGIEELNKDEVNKFYLYSEDKEELTKAEIELKEILKDDADVFFSYHSVLEIMPKGITKGLVLEELMKKEGVNKSEIMAFGDGLNDYEMLSWVGKGLIMENADETLKHKLPNMEVIGCNEDDGVARYLKENIK